MQVRYWWRGMIWAFLPIFLLAAYTSLRFCNAPAAGIDISDLLFWIPTAGSFTGSLRTAFGQGKDGLLAGVSICAGLWIFMVVCLAVLVPELFGTWLWQLFALMLPGGVLGGIAGMSLARIFPNPQE